MKVSEILEKAAENDIRVAMRRLRSAFGSRTIGKGGTSPRGAWKYGAAKPHKTEKEKVGEAWEQEAKLNPEKKGMFDGKTVTQLQHELNALLKAGPHPKGSPGYTKMKELEFAIRAKKAKGGRWGGVMHDNKKADEEDCAMTVG